jgi:hypothetical protein
MSANVTPEHRTVATTVARAPVRFERSKRLLIAGATAFLGINLWTGAPLFSLWLGSQFVGERRLSMSAVCIVVVTLATLVFCMAFALVRLNDAYKRITGHPLREDRLTWLRSFNVRRESPGEGMPTSLMERIVMLNVYLASIALLVYFVAFPQSPILH